MVKGPYNMRFRLLGLLALSSAAAFAQMNVTGSISASQVTSGTFNISLIPTTGVSATKINGTDVSTLTGILKMSSGTPSASASSDVIGLFSGTCSASTFLRGDGSCQVPGGGG